MLATTFNQHQVIESKDFSRLYQAIQEGERLEFLGNGHLLLQSSACLFLIDSKTGTLLQSIPDCSQFAFSKQESKIVVVFNDTAKIFDYSRLDLLRPFKSIRIPFSTTSISSAREVFIQIYNLTFLIADQKTVRIFSLDTLQLLYEHPLGDCQNIVDIKFKSDDCLVLADPNGLVYLFEPSTGSLVPYLQVANTISTLAIHPSVSDLIGIGCVDGSVIIYDLKVPETPQMSVRVHHSHIWQVRFFANTIWTASEDGSVASYDFTDPGASAKLLRFVNPADVVFGLNAFDLDVERQLLFFVGDSGVVSSGSYVFE